MLVKDYMSGTPISVRDDVEYDSAFKIMDRQNLHHLPVLGNSEDVVGIVTLRDLQLAARFFREAPAEVADVMHTPVVTISPDSPLEDAARLMMEKRIGCLPVVDVNGRLIGMLTETDLFRALIELVKQ